MRLRGLVLLAVLLGGAVVAPFASAMAATDSDISLIDVVPGNGIVYPGQEIFLLLEVANNSKTQSHSLNGNFAVGGSQFGGEREPIKIVGNDNQPSSGLVIVNFQCGTLISATGCTVFLQGSISPHTVIDIIVPVTMGSVGTSRFLEGFFEVDGGRPAGGWEEDFPSVDATVIPSPQ